MTYTLGLSYGFHDASAALARDGQIIFSAAEERLSHQKHDRAFPKFAILNCLRSAKISLEQIEAIGYHENPAQTFTRVLAASVSAFPRSGREFTAAMKSWLGEKLWVKKEIAKRLHVDPKKVITFRHHHTHASQAFLSSGFSESAILTVDAVGEWATTGLFVGEYHGDKPYITCLETSDFPNSLGLFYSAMTAYLGFRPMDQECSTMALSAFGTPRYVNQIREIVQVNRGQVFIDQDYFHFTDFYKNPVSERLLKILGPARTQNHRLPFDCLADPKLAPIVDKDSQRFADVAASVQEVFEESVIALSNDLYSRTKRPNLCLAGGGALNCVANAKILQNTPFQNLTIPADPGDGGAAQGAAQLAFFHGAKSHGRANISEKTQRLTPVGAHLGLAITEDDLDFIEHIDPRHNMKYLKLGLARGFKNQYRLEQEKFSSQEALVSEAAKAITSGKIVGWCQGRFENGPRALGNRSILIRPDDLTLAKKLSRDVKSREAYRPYALSFCDFDAERILQDYDRDLGPLRAMQLALAVRDDVQKCLRAGLHVDGTTRPQVVFADEQPLYFELLKEVGQRLGLAAVINTSFNESGYPLVNSATQALAIFARTHMDVLVVGQTVIRKVID
jgi:carbamoyltransferase